MKTKETKLKCAGCKDKMPDIKLDVETMKPTWFGKYNGWQLVEWVCRKCYDKGIKFKK